LKVLIKWTALALVVAAVLVIARDPPYWLGRLGIARSPSGGLQESSYTPRAIVRGGNQPPAPRENPEAEQLDVAALQSAAEYAEKQKSRALIVTRHGYIVFERYWQGSNLDTMVDSQGLGRVLAALATGAAISDRKIGWPDEPLSYFIPQWVKDTRGEITVRNLLQMSSGLASPGPSGPSLLSLGRQPYGGNMIGRYLQLPLDAPPGTRWLDQNVDPDLLGFVIERATGQMYGAYLSEAIWTRIGAGDASVWLDSPGGSAHVDTGFFARQGDWLRVGELLLQNGRYQGDEVIVPRWVPELLRPSKSNSNYGSYMRLGSDPAPGASPYASSDVYTVEGAGNRMWLVPSLQIAILRTGSGTGTEPATDWDDSRIPNLIIRGARDFVPVAARPGADIRQLVPNH
jgi:CubicO group peptidase (beta-lactamase class C family)